MISTARSHKIAKIISLCSSVTLVTGCAVLDTHQAKLDQKQLREVLMDYTDEQILDNLVRASHGLPIVHFDLSNITGSVTSKVIPGVNGSRVHTNVRTRTPTNAIVSTDKTTSGVNTATTVENTVMRSFSFVGGVVDTILRPFNWGVSAERDNAISVQADPLIDNPKVYEAYIRFLNTDVPLGRRNTIEESDEETEVNKVTSTTIDPTIVKKTIVSRPAVDPAATNAPAAFATTTETTETSAAASTSEEGKPKTKPHKIDLVIRSFDFNTLHALQRAQSAPSSAEVIIGPKLWKDGWYYWVPKQYQKEFFALCMAVVARGDNSDAGAEKSDAVKALKEGNAIQRRQELR